MLNRYLGIVRRWLWVLICVPVLGASAAFGLSKLSTPVYEASLTLWVSQASAAGQQYTDILAAERLAKTYGALLTKRPVLQQTITALHLNMTPDQLGNMVSVKLVRDTQLLEVSVRHTDPVEAARIVNKLADVFQDQNLATQKQSFNEATQKLNAQVSQLEGQIKDGQSRLKDLKAILVLTEAQRAEMERLNGSISQYQVAYSSVMKSLEDVRLSEANSINNVTVAEQAAAPRDPVSPRITLNVVVGLVLALLLAVGLVALLEYLDDSFKATEDVQETLGLSTLGVVELVGGKRARRRPGGSKSERPAPAQNLVSLTQVSSHVTEAYRLLRTNLDFASLDRPVRKLLVTSALPQEGKSTTAANLAVVSAQNGKRVLLIDVDLRRPTVHKLFKVPNHHGLTSLLLGVVRPEEAIQEVGIENLQVLTSGPMPPSPADTLSSQAMSTLLDTLAQQYDLIITDSPPVLVASDAVILSSRMDGVLVVVAAGSTSKRVCKNAVESLKRSASPILGVVLNMQRQSGQQSYYYYDYQATKQGEKPKQVPA
jgi:non-specific protein-tyrosine kinase